MGQNLLFFVCLVVLCAQARASYDNLSSHYLTHLCKTMAESSLQSVAEWSCHQCKLTPLESVKFQLDPTSSTVSLSAYSPVLNSVVVLVSSRIPLRPILSLPVPPQVGYSKCSQCKVYEPFRKAASILGPGTFKNLTQLMLDYPKTQKLIIAGYGTGGAVASLLSLYLKPSIKAPIEFYSFGQPRVGNSYFARYFESMIPHSYRIVYGSDIVCQRPAKPYQHFGTQVWYQNSTKDYKLCNGEIVGCSETSNHFGQNFEDHRILIYAKLE